MERNLTLRCYHYLTLDHKFDLSSNDIELQESLWQKLTEYALLTGPRDASHRTDLSTQVHVELNKAVFSLTSADAPTYDIQRVTISKLDRANIILKLYVKEIKEPC